MCMGLISGTTGTSRGAGLGAAFRGGGGLGNALQGALSGAAEGFFLRKLRWMSEAARLDSSIAYTRALAAGLGVLRLGPTRALRKLR